MLRHVHLQHRFVQHIPESLESGVLYISMDYATAVHKCCCGCGEEVVTPFTPTDWKMTFDGETISLSPSIGNWNFACRSHYFIERSRVIEAIPWKERQIESSRQKDAHAKAHYYDALERKNFDEGATPVPHEHELPGLWTRIKGKLRRKR